MNILQTAPPTRGFLAIDDVEPSELVSLLDAADDARSDRHSWSEVLKGRHVALVFDKPSTRTRVSFEVGIAAMGGTPLVLKGDELQLGRGETFEDTARALSCYVDAVVIRIGDHGALERFARGSLVPVVNALTSRYHPCQTLADLQTIRGVFGLLRGVRVAYVGDPNNVAHSLMVGAAMLGMHFALASPPSHPPDHAVVDRASALGADCGGSVTVCADPRDACRNAHVVYTDTWTSMGFEAEEHERRIAFGRYRVDAALLDEAAPDAVVMHCLPAHRGEEITADVLDGPRSVVWEQATNRLYSQMALLRWLVAPPP